MKKRIKKNKDVYVKSCMNCKRGWSCTYNVPDCTHNLDYNRKPKHWIPREETY